MSLVTYPILRFEVEGMKQQICLALTKYSAEMDEAIQTAVDRACQPEAVAQVIQDAAGKAIRAVVAEEVDNFFKYGNGRRAVAKAVTDILSKERV